MKFLCSVTLACSFLVSSNTIALGQGPGMAPNCPYEYVTQLPSGAYQYKTKDCMSSSIDFGEWNGEDPLTLLSPPCNGFACRNQTVEGDGKARTEPVPEPDPVRKLPPAPPAFQDWTKVRDYFSPRDSPRHGFISIQPIRALAKSQLMVSKDRAAAFQQLKGSIPDMLEKYLKAPTYQAQLDMIESFNRRLRAVLVVEVEVRPTNTSRDRYRKFDLPAPPTPNAKAAPAAEVAQSKATVKNLGLVKVVDGGQTFFFELFETTAPFKGNVPPATLRAGTQVSAPSDGKAAAATFVGHQYWSHRIDVNGKQFLVTSKDMREASKP